MAGPGAKHDKTAQPRLRLDKWLFHARFFRSREAASDMIGEGHLRLNGQHCLKPGHAIGAGDVLTFVQAGQVRVIRVLAISLRRGPATEAQTLYHDLDAEKPGLTPQGAEPPLNDPA